MKKIFWLMGLALAAFALRAGFIYTLPEILFTIDSNHYFKCAESLINDLAFWRNGSPETFRTPGYPAFLALCQLAGFKALTQIAFVQAVLSSLEIFIVSYLLYRLFSFSSAVTAALVLTVYPADWHFTTAVLSETYFTFLIAVLVFIWLRHPFTENLNHFLVGVFTGLAALTRPIAMWLFIPLMLLRAWQAPTCHSAIRALVMILIGIFLTQGIWVLRNHKVYGAFYFSEVSTASLYIYWAQAVRAYPSNNEEAMREEAWVEWLTKSTKHPPPQMIKEYGAKAFNIIKEHPARVGILFPRYAYRQVVDSSFTKFMLRYFPEGAFSISGLLENIQNASWPRRTLHGVVLMFRLLETALVGLTGLAALVCFARYGFYTERQAPSGERVLHARRQQKHAVWLAMVIAGYLFVLSCTPAANIRFREQYFFLVVFLGAPVLSQVLKTLVPKIGFFPQHSAFSNQS